MNCVRCLADGVLTVAHAPDGSGAWEIYRCTRCNYSWRSSEPENITNLEKRDPSFQLTKDDLEGLVSPLPIPPLSA